MEDKKHITADRVVELKTTVSHAKWSDLFDAKKDAPPADVTEAIDAYLAPFAQWTNKSGTNECINCGTPQAGFMGAMMGGFTWGLAHGEGFCATCKWPGRAYHKITEANGEHLASFSLVLQYHPDCIEFAKATA